MTVAQAGVVDSVNVANDGSRYTLVMIEDRPFGGSPEQVDQLIEKVNGYVAFIQTGQLYERYPEAADRSLGVRLICVDEPDEAVRQVLAAAAGLFARHGAEFVVEIVPPALVSGLG